MLLISHAHLKQGGFKRTNALFAHKDYVVSTVLTPPAFSLALSRV